ncbi:hypothetical protein C1637_17485 [Chryseobacterium lactis]|uniref:Bacteriocin n=1 Tax=Chryseobacterium lactis TaxID=1241981 RepID=A0A3G6RHK0_CHRLC|nr:hypothetical protein [Chryseobacterium lactis]AZA82970.1 hypothetical protein EG342_14265 [Chryseobacterium lactis]AZB03353.1 hypothetical protein EG341_05130 [Chryseobacterium lactis]PNW12361.1 hypothetical protein C1637_17485 [Chryseobacterium lactis]
MKKIETPIIKKLESLEKFRLNNGKKQSIYAGSPVSPSSTCTCSGGGCRVVMTEEGPRYVSGNWSPD